MTAETREHVVQAFLQVNHSKALKALDEREEAVSVVGVAADMAVAEIRSNVGLEPQAFDEWFENANGSEDRRAA